MSWKESMALCLSVGLFASGCTSPTTAATDAGDEGAEDTGDGDGDGDGDGEPGLADGLSIRRVEANQGAGVTIGINDEYVASRDASLIRGRSMLIRALIDVEDDWEAREITGRLSLGVDGEVEERDITTLVSASSPEGSVEFAWKLDADEVVPGLQYQVSFYETDPERPPADDSSPVNPASGPELLGVEDVDARMKIKLIPITETTCGETGVVDDQVVEQIRSRLFSLNPVQEIVIETGEPLELDFNGSNCFGGAGLAALAALRDQEEAPPEQFYIGIATQCAGMNCSCLGVHNDEQHEGSFRSMLAAPVDGGQVVDPSYCMGLLQGRRPVSGCDTIGADPSYPYEDGTIGTWGYSVLDDSLIPPETSSYMSFCDPSWVSDWGWQIQHKTIQLLTSWE